MRDSHERKFILENSDFIELYRFFFSLIFLTSKVNLMTKDITENNSAL